MQTWIKLATAATLALSTPALAQNIGVGMPRSASDWLSGTAPPPPPSSAWRPGDQRPAEAERRRPLHPPSRPLSTRGSVASSAAVPHVGVTRLADGNPDARGAVTAGAAGLPSDLWGGANATDLTKAISSTQPRLRTTRGLLVRMLTAQLAPPSGSAAGDEGRLFLTRVDRLIALGLLPDAQALLQTAGAGDADRFARRFDLAMYEGDATNVCRLLAERPGLAPDLAARVYCLAQAGDWSAAALTLHGARDQGLIPQQTVALLERFLDDSTADLTEALPDPRAITPLEFRLYEAIGQPLATGELPIAFAWADLGGDSGWKAQIEAAERLARIGAIDPSLLSSAYLDQKPAASGGIWDRAASFQRLDNALNSGDSAALAVELENAGMIFGQVGLLPALARLIAPRLPATSLEGPAAETAGHLRLLAGVPVPGAARLPKDDRALVVLAETPLTSAAKPTEPAQSTLPPLQGTEPTAPPYSAPAFAPGSVGASYADALRATPLSEAPPEGRGMGLLSAIADVEAGLDGDVSRAANGLRRLVELGQPEVARSAAVELLLTEHLGGLRR